MSNDTPTLAQGEEYIVRYRGGPFDGQDDRRVAGADGWDESLTVLAAQEGKETQLIYERPQATKIGDQVQVTYTWDQDDSEPLEDPQERTGQP